MHDSMINDRLLIISIFNLLQEEMKSSLQNFSQKFLCNLWIDIYQQSSSYCHKSN